MSKEKFQGPERSLIHLKMLKIKQLGEKKAFLNLGNFQNSKSDLAKKIIRMVIKCLKGC